LGKEVETACGMMTLARSSWSIQSL
jgi:hypothetical protein